MKRILIFVLAVFCAITTWAWPGGLGYKTPDLQMMQAKGNVKYIKFDHPLLASCFKSGICYFDKNGWIDVNQTCFSKTTVERNGKWQLVGMYREYEAFTDESDFPLGCSSEWLYNSSGLVTKIVGYEWEWVDTKIYIYDEEDVVVEMRMDWSDSSGGGAEIYYYSNYTYDSYGNWISRDVVLEEKYYDLDGSCEGTEYKEYVETRTIVYYE